MIPPGEPSGQSAEKSWLRALRRFIISSRIISGVDYRVKQGSEGTTLEFLNRGGGMQLQTYIFKSMGTDHIVCRTWDGTNQGSTDIKIAKIPDLWFSNSSEAIDGTTYNYTSYSTGAQTRVSTPTGGTAEVQVIVPRYLPDDSIIFAVSAQTFVTVDSIPIGLLDLNLAGRAWSKV